MNITINPNLTSNARGTFGVDWNGLIQGVAMDDPSARNALSGGVVAAGEALPMWGGIGVYNTVPADTTGGTRGGAYGRATLLTGAKALTGFSVFNQNHSAINSPQSEVPLIAAGMTGNYYELGSGARIAVKIDPALVSLSGGLITAPVSWDFNGQMLSAYVASYLANVITNAVWSAGKITFTTTTAHGVTVGGSVSISGFTPDAYNGDYIALAGTAGSTLVVTKVVDPGADTVQGRLDAGGGALPCKIETLSIGNSMEVVYDAATGFASWNRNGNCAVIRI